MTRECPHPGRRAALEGGTAGRGSRARSAFRRTLGSGRGARRGAAGVGSGDRPERSGPGLGNRPPAAIEPTGSHRYGQPWRVASANPYKRLQRARVDASRYPACAAFAACSGGNGCSPPRRDLSGSARWPAIGVRFTGARASRCSADAKPGSQPAAWSAASTAASRPGPDGISRRAMPAQGPCPPGGPPTSRPPRGGLSCSNGLGESRRRAEFERELIRERTVAGLKAARARGRKGGRKFAL